MKRKMTRFALGGNRGIFGAMGFTDAAPAGAARAPFSRRSCPSAMAPTPTPHWRKNQRRVRSLRHSAMACSCFVMASFPCDGLVEVQEDAGHDGIGSELRGR